MLLVSIRDLQWRRRRFFIALLATALVFALAMVLTGISQGFRNEVTRTVNALDADRWLVPSTATGPFTSSRVFPATSAEGVGAMPGVEAADAILIGRESVRTPKLQDVAVIGVVPGGLGNPQLDDGRGVEAPGEIVADRSLGLPLDGTVRIGETAFRIVGRTSGLTSLAGAPTLFIPIGDAQRLSLGGQSLASTILTRGVPESTPEGFRAMTADEVMSDLRRPLRKATATIDLVRVLLWIVAAGIIGSIVYLQSIERTRDFAVLKATGTTSASLFGGLAIQAVVLALTSAAAAFVLAFALAPLLPVRIEIPGGAYALLPLVAIVVGLLASLAGLRRAVSTDPALAFGGG